MFVFGSVGADKPGSHVGPGENFTYTWQVLDGPSSTDPPCIPYLYYSATDPAADTNAGLVGPLLVCKKGALGTNGIQVLLCCSFCLLAVALCLFVVILCLFVLLRMSLL